MSLTKSFWGEAFWKMLYSVAYTYPNEISAESRQDIEAWYEITALVLPCDECRRHFDKFLEQHPIQNSCTDRLTLLHWVNNLENAINQQMNKPTTSLERRISELDKHNPELKPIPIQNPKRSMRRTGTVSYGVRRSNFQLNQKTETTVQPTSTEALPKRRPRGTVSYGMRKPNPRRGGRCANCH